MFKKLSFLILTLAVFFVLAFSVSGSGPSETPNDEPIVFENINNVETYLLETGKPQAIVDELVKFNNEVEEARANDVSKEILHTMTSDFNQTVQDIQQTDSEQDMSEEMKTFESISEVEAYLLETGKPKILVDELIKFNQAIETARQNDATPEDLDKITSEFEQTIQKLNQEVPENAAGYAWRLASKGIYMCCANSVHARFYNPSSPYLAESWLAAYGGTHYLWYKNSGRWNDTYAWAGDWNYHYTWSYATSYPGYGYARCE